MTIKAIIFDVGGVLMTGEVSSHGIWEHMALKLGIDMDTWMDSIDTVYAKSIEGKIDGKKAVKTIARNLEIDPVKLEKLWIQAYKVHSKRDNELYKIAYSLKKKGYMIGILSDQWYLGEKALITKEDRKKFNPVIVSCDVGCRKPSVKIYKILIKRLKLSPSEILFIDNRDWNTRPAAKLGIKTILFKNNKQTLKDIQKFDISV